MPFFFRSISDDMDHGFVVVVDNLHVASKRRHYDTKPLGMYFYRINAIDTRTIHRCDIESDGFRDKFMVTVRVLITRGWSGSRQVVLHIGIAGWITTDARDWKRLRRHCRCFRSTRRTGDSRRILNGFQNFLR